MKMMANLKIGMKLLIGFGCVLVLMVVLAVLAITRLKIIDSDYTYVLDFPVNRLSAIDDVEASVALLRRATSAIGLQIGNADEIAKSEAQIHDQIKDVNSCLDKYDSFLETDTTISESNKQLRVDASRKIRQDSQAYYNNYSLPIIALAKKGDLEGIGKTILSAQAATKELNDAVESLVTASEEITAEQSAQCTATANQALVMLIIITIIAVVIGVGMAALITLGITKPVSSLTDVLTNVAKGNLNVNASSNARDEIGGLTRDVGKVVDIINSLVRDIDDVSEEFKKGEIDSRIDVEKYEGSFMEVAAGFNNTINDLITEILKFIDCMVAFSEGDFEANFARLPGKKEVMNTSRDQLRGNLMGVNNDIASLVENASNGNLDTKLDAGKYKGDWSSLVQSLNKLVEAIATPINEASTALEEMSKGNLGARMTGVYRGQFDLIEQAVNGTMEAVGSYIQEISDVLGKMATENDLTQEITRQYVGDFNQIKASINMIMDRMSQVMGDFNSAAAQVSSGSKIIADSSMSLAQGATEQASAVQQLNASVDLISEKTMKSSEDAEGANQLSIRSRENALAGNEEMGRMLVSMEDIKTSSDNISKINKVIEDIAFQTNLLALNAAVEAARAGDHGKGFAVVADEVRNLAARSQNASKETSELIQESIMKVEEGQKIATTTAESLKTIVEDFTQVSSIISGIAEAAKDQNGSIQQISIGLGQISQVVQNNSSTSEESAATAEQLSGQAETFRNMIAEFKTKKA